MKIFWLAGPFPKIAHSHLLQKVSNELLSWFNSYRSILVLSECSETNYRCDTTLYISALVKKYIIWNGHHCLVLSMYCVAARFGVCDSLGRGEQCPQGLPDRRLYDLSKMVSEWSNNIVFLFKEIINLIWYKICWNFAEILWTL